jgi:hypothetical protein
MRDVSVAARDGSQRHHGDLGQMQRGRHLSRASRGAKEIAGCFHGTTWAGSHQYCHSTPT